MYTLCSGAFRRPFSPASLRSAVSLVSSHLPRPVAGFLWGSRARPLRPPPPDYPFFRVKPYICQPLISLVFPCFRAPGLAPLAHMDTDSASENPSSMEAPIGAALPPQPTPRRRRIRIRRVNLNASPKPGDVESEAQVMAEVEAEDRGELDPLSSDPDVEAKWAADVATRCTSDAGLRHDSLDEIPPIPVEGAGPATLAKGITYRFDLTLRHDDPRVPSMDLLMVKIREVLEEGARLAPAPKRIAFTKRGTIGPVKTFGGVIAPEPARGRPSKPRRGWVEAPGGGQQRFDSMPELARILGASYPNLCTKYAKACEAAGVDRDAHNGVTFEYKGVTVHLTVL